MSAATAPRLRPVTMTSSLSTLLPTRASRVAAAAFAAAAVTNLVAELADNTPVAHVAQALVMPALAATVALAARGAAHDVPPAGPAVRENSTVPETGPSSAHDVVLAEPVQQAAPDVRRLVRWTVVGLALSAVGDIAPKFAGEHGFLVMVGGFLLAQLAYVTAFWPYARRSPALRPLPLAGYAAFGVAVVASCAAQAGPLTAAVVVYAAALSTMSATAWGLGRTAGIGGLVFLASDTLIALRSFTAVGDHLPAAGFWVMSTYIVGQALLAAGVLQKTTPK